MPELPEVEAERLALVPVLLGARVARVVLNRSGLRRPFPTDFATRISGATVRHLTRRAKYLLAELSSGETLLMHLGMSGSFRIESSKPAPAAHDHVIFHLTSGATLVFNDPRRFGVMDLVPTVDRERRPPLSELGPEPLSLDFDGATLARACAHTRRPLKVALLDQQVVAGVGNIYASEALHVARLSPRQRASSLATRNGHPSAAANRLATAIKAVLTRAIAHHTKGRGSQRFRVYDREGEACPRRTCSGVIKRFVQAARSTFYCPVCQRSRPKGVS